MCSNYFIPVIILLQCLSSVTSDLGHGPDPWDLSNGDWQQQSQNQNDENVPPDLSTPQKKVFQSFNNLGNGEWFSRRILNIVLKGGQVQKSEDESVDILLKIRLSAKQWNVLNEYLKSNDAFTDDTYRRILGYIEEAVQPTIADTIAMAWTEYIQYYLIEYKLYIIWILTLAAATLALLWLWNRMSHKHFIIALFLSLYMYEVLVSYKECEKKELDNFLQALESCSWKFWSSNCEVPKPDPLIFLKHMNPLKIGIRMFTNLVSEPIISLNDTVQHMVHSLTDGLVYPFNKIFYGILVLALNVLMLVLLIMIVFNYIFNIPFNLSFLGIGLGIPQRNRNLFTTSSNCSHNLENVDRISGQTLDRLLDVFSRALPVTQNNNYQEQTEYHPCAGLRRSASTGRLCDKPESSNNRSTFIPKKEYIPRRRQIKMSTPTDGSGDAH